MSDDVAGVTSDFGYFFPNDLIQILTFLREIFLTSSLSSERPSIISGKRSSKNLLNVSKLVGKYAITPLYDSLIYGSSCFDITLTSSKYSENLASPCYEII